MLTLRNRLIFLSLGISILGNAKVLPFGSISLGMNEVKFYPEGYSPDFVESNVFSIIDADKSQFGPYFNTIATFCGADNLTQSDNVIKKTTLVGRFISHNGRYIPVLAVGEKAFKNAVTSEAWLQDAVIFIDDEAFFNAENITSLTLPMSLAYLGSSSLSGMKALKEIYFRAPLPPVCKVEYASQFSDLIQLGSECDKLTSFCLTPFGKGESACGATVYVPRGSMSFYLMHPVFAGLELEEYDPETEKPNNPQEASGIRWSKSGNFTLEATSYKENATSLEIPSSIAAEDFALTVSMKENPYSVTGIGYRAFANSSTTNFSIPSTVIYIKDEAFAGSEAENIIIGEGVRFVGNRAFADLKNLKTVTLLPSATDEKRIFAPDAFEGICEDAVLECDFTDPTVNRFEAPFNAFSKIVDHRSGVNFLENAYDYKLGVSVVNGKISLCNYSEEPVKVTVVNTAGQNIFDKLIETGETIIPVANGIYIIKTGSTYRKFIVK